jgi:predicted ester cyclase
MKKQQSILFGPLLAVLFFSCGAGGDRDGKMAEHMAMMKADSAMKATQTAREEGCRVIFAMFESGNSDGVEKYIAENMTEHTPMPGITSTGIQAVKEAITMHHGAFPDTKMTALTFAHNGDVMMVHYNMKGTNTGDMGDMPATGKTFDVNGVDIIRFEGDKAIEHWGYTEEMKMMTQLGLMPPPGEKKMSEKKL